MTTQPKDAGVTDAPASIDQQADQATDQPAEPEPAPAAAHRRWFRYTLPGLWVALLFACVSFTPSLLPRSGLVQGFVCGMTGAIGYGIGTVGAWVWRAFADRDVRPPRPHAWRLFLLTAVAALVVSFIAGQRWQTDIRELMGVTGPGVLSYLLLPVIAAVVFVALIAVSRALRAVYRWLAHLLNRWIGRRAARMVGWAAVVVATYGLVSGVLLNGLVTAADQTFSVRDTITPEGVVQPTGALRSGGPDSLLPWDSLGREGRKFVGTGPSAAEIGAYTGSPAVEPIRVYAGIASAGDAEARAELAVRDLERAGGFDRAYLLVTTTTGSGWVDPASVDTFEYLTGGNSAIIGMQYSYLPSWISYLVDQADARLAGRELYDAVYESWSQLPPNRRPKLLVSGESLGSFGGEAAFSGEHDLANRSSGTLFAGPPNFNTLYREFTDDRDEGSAEVRPIFRGGRTVRFDDDPEPGVEPAAAPWDGTRVLYLQHPSDPIVWWSPNLIMSRPDWLSEPPGRDVLDEMTWLPFVTFWQVTADLPLAAAVPAGHGHTYIGEYVDAWATVLRVPDWTPEKAARLRAIIEPGS